jgi:hypothetical protein
MSNSVALICSHTETCKIYMMLQLDMIWLIFLVQTQSVSELKDFVRRLHSLPEIAVSSYALILALFWLYNCILALFDCTNFMLKLETCPFGTTLAIIHGKALLSCATGHRTNNIRGSEFWSVSISFHLSFILFGLLFFLLSCSWFFTLRWLVHKCFKICVLLYLCSLLSAT